jgi:hypothetical protein
LHRGAPDRRLSFAGLPEPCAVFVEPRIDGARHALPGFYRIIPEKRRNPMIPFRKAAVALAAVSLLAAPVAASAAPAVSATAGQSQLEGDASWLIGLAGLLAGVVAIIIIADDDDDAPVSP